MTDTLVPSALRPSSGPLARAVAEREVEHEDVHVEATDELGGVGAAVGLRHDLEPGVLAADGDGGPRHRIVVADHRRRHVATPESDPARKRTILPRTTGGSGLG